MQAFKTRNTWQWAAWLACWALALCMAGAPLAASAGAYEDFMFAVKFDDVATVRELLRQGMDVNATAEARGETVMMLALRENSMKVFDLLLKSEDIQIEARAANGDSAVMIASFAGNLDGVKKLLAAGAQINRPGWTALHYAAAKGSVEIIALLLEHAAYIDAESPNKTTPLMMAASSGNIAAVKLLLDEGADLSLINEAGLNALDFAFHYEKPDIAEGLAYRMSLLKK